MHDLFKRNRESFVFLEKYTDQNESDFNQIKDYIRHNFHLWYNELNNESKNNHSNPINGNNLDAGTEEKITEQLPDLIRLLKTSMTPFIREDVSTILDDFRLKNFFVPEPIYSSPSAFISLDYLDHLKLYFDENNTSESSPAFNVCLSHFYEFTRLENYIQVMAFHPKYLEAYLNLFDNLFSLELPMSQNMRFFLGIVAAAEMRCEYLVNLFARYFITYAGDADYLKGLSALPSRWKRLISLNSKLAHQPWNIGKEEIYDLTHRKASSAQSQEVFSVNEILLAIIIMSHVHSLSCFILGCGINPELDHPNALTTQKKLSGFESKKSSFQSVSSYEDKSADINEELVMKQFLEVLKLNVITDRSDDDLVHKKFEEVCDFNTKLDRFQPSEWIEMANERTLSMNSHHIISSFLVNQNSGYSSFIGVPRQLQNQNWTDELIPMVDQLNCDIASGLDMTSKAAYELTYHKVNDVDNVDTSSYRLTIWNIVLSFFGVFNDEYSYEMVDKLLPLEQRAFLKRCFTRPYEIPVPIIKPDGSKTYSPYEYHHLMPALHPSEVVHVMIMAMEARRQACLFYSLKATAECQSMSS